MALSGTAGAGSLIALGKEPRPAPLCCACGGRCVPVSVRSPALRVSAPALRMDGQGFDPEGLGAKSAFRGDRQQSQARQHVVRRASEPNRADADAKLANKRTAWYDRCEAHKSPEGLSPAMASGLSALPGPRRRRSLTEPLVNPPRLEAIGDSFASRSRSSPLWC